MNSEEKYKVILITVTFPIKYEIHASFCRKKRTGAELHSFGK